MVSLGVKASASFALRTLIVALFVFVPAGSLDFWQAWICLPALLVPQTLVGFYFLKKDPVFLKRRLKCGFHAENRVPQKVIMFLMSLMFTLLLIVSGFDHRFGWSQIPPIITIAADAMIVLGILIQFSAFNANCFASATIGIESNQTLISTGPYAVVRHPMYSGSLLVNLFIPIALGSWLALAFAAAVLVLIMLRILDEEKLLRESLPGYPDYCRNVPYRLIPRVW